jgi:hypothetical protein
MRTTFTVLLFLLVLQGYVVYLGDADPALHSDSVKANHHNILSSAVGSLGAAENAMLYSYRNVFNGFSAHLSAEEFSLLSGKLHHHLGPAVRVEILLLNLINLQHTYIPWILNHHFHCS